MKDFSHIVVVSEKKITLSSNTMKQPQNEVSDQELKRVIADFLDQGHVENIVAMFRREPKYYSWTGEILSDERFNVRLGISVLFEELLVNSTGQTYPCHSFTRENPGFRTTAITGGSSLHPGDNRHERSSGRDPSPS